MATNCPISIPNGICWDFVVFANMVPMCATCKVKVLIFSSWV